MSNDHSVARPAARGLTLNSLKDELHSLNMRLLLAIQYHNQETQEDIEAQMATVQKEIDLMCMGGGRAGSVLHGT